MRIISGLFKGKSINFIKNSKTRPLKDSVRENIFNILKHSKLININIENSKILDLYAGVGSFGLEGISRGAKMVTFIERDKNTGNILKENLNKLSIINKFKFINNNIETALESGLNEKFNIFFLDPPFLDNKFIQILNLIKRNNIYETKHIIIIHRERESKDNFENNIKIILTKKYGRSKILFGLFS